MKIDKQTFKYIMIIVTFAIFLFVAMLNFGLVLNVIGIVVSATFPFILGFFFAFILNLPMKQFEKMFSRAKRKWVLMIKRPVSLILSFISIFLILTLVVVLIIPQLARAVTVLVNLVPQAIEDAINYFGGKNEIINQLENYIKQLNINLSDLGNQAMTYASGTISTIFSLTVNFVFILVGGLINIVVALVISVYILLTKETLKLQLKKLIKAYLPLKAGNYILHVLHVCKVTFSKYIVGQCTEACILGTLCALGMTILGLPFAPMVGAMMGILALIPIIGIAVAVIIGTFMILMVNPMQALIFLIFYVVLQQIEGNFIYPRVVGSSIGIAPFFVLTAILVGGGLFGILGMVFAVPTVSVIYKLVGENANKRLVKKGIKNI